MVKKRGPPNEAVNQIMEQLRKWIIEALQRLKELQMTSRVIKTVLKFYECKKERNVTAGRITISLISQNASPRLKAFIRKLIISSHFTLSRKNIQ